MGGSPLALVTTSWDDGHPLDLRVAGLLARHEMKGTFYVPLAYPGFERLTPSEMRSIESCGMEIGSHTVTHRRLPGLTGAEALREMKESRDGLEQLLGAPVRSFCFPEGKFSQRDVALVTAAGYELSRTTVAFRTAVDFHPYAMPVSFQLWPHSRLILARHAAKEGNFAGLWNWVARSKGESDLDALAERMLDYIEKHGGILHIWGHSWEIESAGLWPVLERVLARCGGRPHVRYCTNIGALEAMAGSREAVQTPVHV